MLRELKLFSPLILILQMALTNIRSDRFFQSLSILGLSQKFKICSLIDAIVIKMAAILNFLQIFDSCIITTASFDKYKDKTSKVKSVNIYNA